MEKVVGVVISTHTKVVYSVKWSARTQSLWIGKKGKWKMIHTGIKTRDEAMDFSQEFVDRVNE